MTAALEFSRPVPLARLGAQPFRQEIAASEAERAALARRFGLVSLDRLCAEVELVKQAAGMILLRASFEAEFVQECVVTLDPVPGAVAEHFALVYGPPEAEESAAGIVGDEVAFEPLDAQSIDIGEAVAQEFSLALPRFPRVPGAEAEIGQSDETGPFGGLSRFLERGDSDPR